VSVLQNEVRNVGLKNAQVWEDAKKTKKLEKLLSDLEQLLE